MKISKNKLGMQLSSQGLIPFIKLNGYTVEDSHKCIEYLTKVFQKDLNSDLTLEQNALSRAIKAYVDAFAGYNKSLHHMEFLFQFQLLLK